MQVIFLTVIGFLLIFLDLMFIPGGIFVVLGSGVILYGVYESFVSYGPLAGSVHLALVLASIPWMVKFSFGRLALKEEMDKEDGYVGVPDRSIYVGLQGKARSSLRPAGSVVVTVNDEEEYLDCIAEGGFIEKGEDVMVVEDRGASLVVRAVSEPASLAS